MEKNALIIGIKNEESNAYFIAKELKRVGYEIYATYPSEENLTDVKRVAEELGIKKLFKYDARKDDDLEKFSSEVKKDNIKLDAIVHAIAYASATEAKRNNLLSNVNWEEFTDAIRVGAFSLVEVCGKLIDNLNEGAGVITLTSRLSNLAVPGLNVIGAAKAALESMIRGLAQSLGKAKKIKVNGICPGPVHTSSLSLLGNSLEILEEAKKKSPLQKTVDKADIGKLAVTILSNNSLTGTIYKIDTGLSIMG